MSTTDTVERDYAKRTYARLVTHAAKLSELLALAWEVPAAQSRAWHAYYTWHDGTPIRATLAQLRYTPGGFQVGVVTRFCPGSTATEALNSGLAVDTVAAAVFLGLDDIDPEAIEWRIAL